jgi:uncharacterized protein (TIGR00369 family)
MTFPSSVPFVDLLGFEFISCVDGQAEVAIELRPELSNAWAVAHGGLTMTLLDVAMAHAARSTSAEPNSAMSVVTLEMKTTFMRPGLGRMLAKARRLHATPSLAFCEASVFDANEALVAHATATFKYLTGLPTGRRKINKPS